MGYGAARFFSRRRPNSASLFRTMLACSLTVASESLALTIQSYLLTPTGDGRYTAQAVGNAEGGVIWAGGLNNSGQVVGEFHNNSRPGAYIWDQTQGIRRVGPSGPDADSVAFGVNDQGQVVGWSSSGGFIWDEANGTRGLRGVDTEAHDINNVGQVTGSAGFTYRPYFWTAEGTEQPLGSFAIGSGMAINNMGQVAGTGGDVPNNQHAFLWSEAAGVTVLGFPGESFSVAQDLNDAAQVVGFSRAENLERAFLWTQAGGMQALPQFGFASAASGINNAGAIVGYCVLREGGVENWHAAIWENGRVIDLNTLVMPGFAFPLSYAQRINDHGQILATYDSSLSPIPEPATISILLLAAVVLVLTRRSPEPVRLEVCVLRHLADRQT